MKIRKWPRATKTRMRNRFQEPAAGTAKMLAIGGLGLALLAPALARAEETQFFVGRANFTVEVDSSRGSESVLGRFEMQAKATESQIAAGQVILQRLNMVFYDVDQSLLHLGSTEEDRGTVGIQLDGNNQALAYDPQAHSLTGSFPVKIDYSALKPLLGWEMQHDDSYAAYKHLGSASFTIDLANVIEATPDPDEIDYGSVTNMDVTINGTASGVLADPEFRFTEDQLTISEVIGGWTPYWIQEIYLPIRPVFTGTTSAAGAWDTQIDAASPLWAKSNVGLTVRPSTTALGGLHECSLDFLERESETRVNLGATDDPDAVEVYVCNKFQNNALGGGVASDRASVDSYIFISDWLKSTPQDHVLAHEIGHTVNLIHPDTPLADPSELSSTGTVMCTGAWGLIDNPSVQSEHNTDLVNSPLLTFQLAPPPQGVPDCTHDTDCGACP